MLERNEGAFGRGQTPARHIGRFEGNASEYFGIWIVNLLLSIVTLGIYTAWAKVRQRRYFYGNTILDGHSFDYHAKPIAILKGRVIVVVALVMFQVLSSIQPFLILVLLPAYIFLAPWVFNRALTFNARVTSYRNVRFHFQGRYRRALLVFIVMPFLTAFTFGLLYPVVSKMTQEYIGDSTYYGSEKFHCQPRLGPYYKNLGACVTVAIVVLAVTTGIVFTVTAMPFWDGLVDRLAENQGGSTGDQIDNAFSLGMFLMLLAVYPVFILSYIAYRAGVRNITFNATTIANQHRLQSGLKRRRYVWILVTNLFAMILTLGLLRPWASVRTWRYIVGHTAVLSKGPLDDFADKAGAEGSVTASQFLDIEGIDFGL
ncbi:DUF898 domain-containing protein [Hoeflea sp. WL0058]|uniref:DUF898 domain-containing protein n=1 Tax=Flavimaribacter sediminis TaxID=2865987 RepID=A0AAE2ZLY0_9HYPH|nr:YjgN family protein [Flavimaribacter sediminis]MBW8635732.1 DUF898 domain-containing protein [Flavimaribacter sediminis]